jgi:hypothetical protein
MKHTTPLSRLAELVGVDYASLNQADAQNATCTEAEKTIRAQQHRINQLHGRVAQTERENAELRAKLDMLENPDKGDIRKIATDFYYWWHNQPGTNTADGFDDWFECVFQGKTNYPEIPDGSASDTDRLDYLDSLNKEFNKRNNSNYGWEIDWNHNRIALHDIGPMGMSVRQAIDEHRERVTSHQKAKEAEHG